MGRTITVTGRLRTFYKTRGGKLRLLAERVEPREDGKPVILEAQGETEKLVYRRREAKAVLVRKRGHLAGNKFYVMEGEIGSEFDQTNPHPGFEGRGHHVY